MFEWACYYGFGMGILHVFVDAEVKRQTMKDTNQDQVFRGLEATPERRTVKFICTFSRNMWFCKLCDIVTTIRAS